MRPIFSFPKSSRRHRAPFIRATLLGNFRQAPFVAMTLLLSMVLGMFPRFAWADAAPSADPGSASGASGLGIPESSGAAAAGDLASIDPSTGAVQMGYPFELPPARGQIQPSLSISYQSSGGDGEAGNWHLSVPSIERRAASGAADPQYNDPPTNVFPTPNVEGRDRFLASGNELVPVCYGGNDIACKLGSVLPGAAEGDAFYGWSIFRAAVEHGPAVAYLWSPDHGTWLVIHPGGVWQSYQSTETETLRDGRSGIARWHLTREYDAQRTAKGNITNPINYVWKSDGQGGLELTDLFDTPSDPDNVTDMTGFAHHVRLTYEPHPFPKTNLVRWRATPVHRLTGVDVTSQDITGGARAMVRRYHLAYDQDDLSLAGHPHHSYLKSITMEGRCASSSASVLTAGNVLEMSGGDLPATNCPSIAPTTFTYTGGFFLGYTPKPFTGLSSLVVPPTECQDENFNGLCQGCPTGTAYDPNQCRTTKDGTKFCKCILPDPTPGTSPPVNELKAASIVDFDNDGWPDLLIPAVNGRTTQKLCTNQGKGAFVCDGVVTALPKDTGPAFTGDFNNGDGSLNWLVLGTMADTDPLGGETDAFQDVTTYTPVFTSPNLDGTPSHNYTLQAASTIQWNFVSKALDGFRIVEKPITTTDVNGDGLTDLFVFRTVAVPPNHSLPPPNSDGYGVALTTKSAAGQIFAFNHGGRVPLDHSDLKAWTPFNARLTTAVTPIWITLPNAWNARVAATGGKPPKTPAYDFADMNGDGLVDIVAVAPTPLEATSGPYALRYWPGYGDGTFGTRIDGTEGSLPMALGLPAGFDPYATHATFHDLNGDGLADLILASRAEVKVFVNLDGTKFNHDPWVVLKADDLGDMWATDEAKLSFADVDASGTDDLVFADKTMGYVDPIDQETVPGLLTSVSNGVGATTSFAYEALARLDKSVTATTVRPWTKHSPQNVHVATSVTTTNGLTGTQKISRSTAYAYRDPVYEPRSRQFRGFESVTTTRGGDDVSLPIENETTFIVGTCPHAQGVPCPVAFDNPFNAIRSLPVVTETRAPSGDFLGKWYASQHTRYQVQQVSLAVQGDGRIIRRVFADQTDAYVGDYAAAVGPRSFETVTDLVPSAASDASAFASGTQRTLSLGTAAGTAHLRQLVTRDDAGRVVSTTDYGRLAGGSTPADPIIVKTFTYYTPPGALYGLSKVRTTNTGAGDDAGNFTDGGRTKTYDYNAFGTLTDMSMTLSGTLALSRTGSVPAPDAASAVAPHVVNLVHVDLDPDYAVATRKTKPNGAIETDVFDPKWHQYVLSRSQQTGTAATGVGSLTSSSSYDIGLNRVIAEVDASGAMSTTTFDGLNRPIATGVPSAVAPTMPTGMTTMEYVPVTGGIRRVHVTKSVTVDGTRESWTYLDGFGTKLATLTTADPSQGDGGKWSVGGLMDWSAAGLPARLYVASFWNGDPRTAMPPVTPGAAFIAITYDAFGRALTTTGLDGTPISKMVYHALSTETWDAEDLAGGVHANTPTITTYDGHHRPLSSTQTSLTPAPSSVTTSYDYLPTGELATLTRTYDRGTYAGGGQGTFVRTMVYDTFGRLVQNVEPNTSTATGGLVSAHSYAYDDAGHLVATADARGCGANFFYDTAGRKIADDYVPCTSDQLAYTAPDLTTGNGTEAFYRYDTPEPDQTVDVTPSMWMGRLVSVSDRAAHTRYGYDGRGHVVRTSRQIAKPDATPSLDARYAPHWFERTMLFDYSGRISNESTGADVAELLVNGRSSVSTYYTDRGSVRLIGSDYGPLVSGMKYDADGSVTTETFGDLAQTTSKLEYVTAATKRIKRSTITRGALPSTGFGGFGDPGGGLSITPSDPPPATTLSDMSVVYDGVGNPLTMTEAPAAFDAWAAGAKPVTRTLTYDDRYRVTSVAYDSKGDGFSDPAPGFAAAAPVTASAKRVASQTFEYDGLGNTIKTTDDANTFFDRSLGVITNAPGGNQLMTAGTAADNGGTLAAQYDAAGNTTALTVNRTKACFKGQTCNQVAYTYTWDEIGHLANASRSDNGAPPTSLDYRYDAGGGRVTTARIASQGIFLDRRFNVEIFGSLRLNGAKFDGTDYERTASTEAVYLMAGGSSLARLVYATADSPAQASGTLHVFFEIGDMLGSTSFVLDKDTSEVVEKRTYQAYGGVESEYQPDKWKGFREEYGFTGKELDLEVGLTYFGARYYSAELGRFLSADPLAVHALGADLNPYAYVGGHVATHTDPLGLADKPEPVVDNSGGSANTSPHYDTAQQVDDAYNGDVSAYCDASGCTPVSEEVVFGAAATPPEPPTAPPPGDTGGSSNVMDDSRGFVSFLDHHQREIGIGLIVVGVVLIGVATFGVGLIGIAGAGAAAAAGGGGVVATEVAVGTTIAVVEAEGAAAGVTVLAEVGGAAAEGAEVVSTGAEIAASRGPQATLELALKVQGTTPLSAQTVALLETAEGPTLVGAGEADLTAAQIAVAEQQGLTVTSLEGFHAEQTVINAAGEMGLKPTVGVATNSVCAARCGSLITEIGGWVKGKFFGF